MKIVNTRTFEGPNVFTHKPAVLMTLDLEDLEEVETRDVPEFNDRLLALIPALHEHVCGKGYPGGFVERLDQGTLFGHVVEHIAIELGHPLGATGNYGKTVRSHRPRCFDIVVQSWVHPVTRYLLAASLDGVELLVRGQTWDVDAVRDEAARVTRDAALGPSTRAIVDAAARRGIPWFRMNDESLVQLGYGCRRRLIQATMSDRTSAIAVEVAQDKGLTKCVLEQAFLPVPDGRTVASREEARAALAELGGCLVVKPVDGNQGRGVTVGVESVEQMDAAFEVAARHSKLVIVEEMLLGDDHRVLVVGGRMVAASRRTPPCVVGDGTRTIADLVAEANRDERRGESHEKPLTRIRIDDVALECLARQHLAPDSIPPRGTEVPLRDNANLSTGGTATDVTDRVHPQVRELCERTARVIGLDICGIDYMSVDVSEPPTKRCGIVEVNAGPGIRMHVHPSRGEARDVGGAVVDMLFPPPSNGRIPSIAITGTNGKTTVTRMIGHVMSAAGLKVGMTTTDGVWIDGRVVAQGDMTGPWSARVVLSDPLVEVAVLETARGGIVRSGLGYDWSDIGVITNIQLDHIGQDGIESLEDIAHIKALVAERVKAGGSLILNADDDRVMELLDRPQIVRQQHRVGLFSMFPNHHRVRRHVADGGSAYVPRNGWIEELHGWGATRLVEIASIPSVLGGVARFNLANALAAAAACRAHGLQPAQIAAGLQAFDAHLHNRGRGNLYRVDKGYVLLDYGHNPAAIDAVARMGALWTGRRLTGIIGLPGDRADWVLQESARVAARAFDRVIVREDQDRRGRAPGEVPRLLCDAISNHAPAPECRTVSDEAAALRTALDSMEPEEVVVVFYESLEAVRHALVERGAIPTTRVDPIRVDQHGAFRAVRRG